MTTMKVRVTTPIERLEAAYLVLRDAPGLTAAQVGEGLGLDAETVRAALGRKINRFALMASERDPKPQLFPDASLKKILREAAKTLDPAVILTAGRYKVIRQAASGELPAVATIVHRFGSWRRALDAAGIAHRDSSRVYDRKWSEDDMTLCVADAFLATGTSSFRGYEDWAKGREDVPAQVRITSDRTWAELATDAYAEFASGGRRRTQYQSVLSGLAKERRTELG